MRTIVRECVAVGRAEGAKLEDSIPDEIVAAHAQRARAMQATPCSRIGGPAGRWRYDARNGVIVRLGRKHGIAAPMNALMVALLEAAQDSAVDESARIRGSLPPMNRNEQQGQPHAPHRGAASFAPASCGLAATYTRATSRRQQDGNPDEPASKRGEVASDTVRVKQSC